MKLADAPKSFALSPEVHEYLVSHGTPPDALQRELIEETKQLGWEAVMQIAPEQGAFLTLFTSSSRFSRWMRCELPWIGAPSAAAAVPMAIDGNLTMTADAWQCGDGFFS